MNTRRILLIVVIAIGFFALLGGCSFYNSAVEKQEFVNQNWSQVKNVYQRRADLIPNLVNTVKGSAGFEERTLTGITEARARVGQIAAPARATDNPEAAVQYEQAQAQLGQQVRNFIVSVEAYPQLRSTEAFQGLMSQLEGSENRISVERRKYIQSIQDYNTHVRRFPGNIFAGFTGFRPIPYFEGDAGNEKVPTVQF